MTVGSGGGCRGAADVDVYEPNYEPTRVERELFPEPKRTKRPGW